MNRITLSLLAGLCVCLNGCHSIGTVASTGDAGSDRVAQSTKPAGLLSKLKLGRRPESNDRLLSLARLMEHHGRHEEAAKMYQSVLERDPTDRTAQHRLGCLAVRRGEHDEGLEYFQLAASGGDVATDLLNDMGYVLYLKHDLKSAEAKLRESLQQDPQYKNARNNLGLVLAEQGKHDEALTEFRAAGDEASSYSNLAFVQTKLGLLTEAEKNYHRALELDPKQRQAAEALVQFSQMGRKIETLAANQTNGKQVADQKIQQPAEKPTAGDRVAVEHSAQVVPLRDRGYQNVAGMLTVVDRGASPFPVPLQPVPVPLQSVSPIQFAGFEEVLDMSAEGVGGRKNLVEVARSRSGVSDHGSPSKSGDSASKLDGSRDRDPMTSGVPANNASKNVPGYAKKAPPPARIAGSMPRALLHAPPPMDVAPLSSGVEPLTGKTPLRQGVPSVR